MFELILPERPKVDNTQFTVTVDTKTRVQLMREAGMRGIAFHRLIKAILLAYSKQIQESENKT